jgi:tetrahydromethanopterin S-methyltransferase subunit G
VVKLSLRAIDHTSRENTNAMATERIDRVESQVDSINSELISFGKTLGEIKGALAEIRWTNRLIIGGFLLFALKEWVWPLFS